MCQQISPAMGFDTADFSHPEIFVLRLGRATLPLVTASLIPGHLMGIIASSLPLPY
jgi:hypothetical protein